MSRLKDALMSSGYNANMTGAFTQNGIKPMVDLRNGGMHGWAATPNLAEYVSNQAYVSRPLVCILLEAPRMFKTMPDASVWLESLRCLFELHARSIEGLSMGLSVDFDEHAVGGAGEMQEEVVNVTRERSQPRFSFVEKYGRPIQTLLDYWIRYGMMDPETKFALLGSRASGDPQNAPKDLMADWYTATCLFFEPDPLHRTVDKAWLVTNMAPKSTGDITSKRDLTSGQEVLNLDIEFTGISQVGLGVNRFAQSILDRIATTNADPYMAEGFAGKMEGNKGGYGSDLAEEAAKSYPGWSREVGNRSTADGLKTSNVIGTENN